MIEKLELQKDESDYSLTWRCKEKINEIIDCINSQGNSIGPKSNKTVLDPDTQSPESTQELSVNNSNAGKDTRKGCDHWFLDCGCLEHKNCLICKEPKKLGCHFPQKALVELGIEKLGCGKQIVFGGWEDINCGDKHWNGSNNILCESCKEVKKCTDV